MSSLEKNIVGYASIIKEMNQIIDMLNNPEIYSQLGAKLPKGILLDGPCGVGKSTICKCFVEDAGLPYYVIRRDSGDNDFIDKITDTFNKAKENSPCIVWCEDVDHWSNEDERHRDAPEFICLQANIDDCHDLDVMVLATCNNADRYLPHSLMRPGRFDRNISVSFPTIEDACEIAKHYMAGKKIDPDLNLSDLVYAIGNDAAAYIETIFNEASIAAGYERSPFVTINHLVAAILRQQYDCPDDSTVMDREDVLKNAMHEGGHICLLECCIPGSTGLASIKSNGRSSCGGFVHRCKKITRRPHDVLISLAGKCAVELAYPGIASGCQEDIERAISEIEDGMTANATMSFGLVDGQRRNSDALLTQQEAAVRAELQRYSQLCREVLIKNKDFLDKCANALAEKETLLYSDIQAIRNSCTITPVEV